MSKHVVGSESELRREGQRIVTVEGRSIGLFFRNGEWFALRNVCPHQGAELCRGLVSGTVVASDGGELAYVMEGRILRCPWHGFEFDLATGRALADPERMRVRTYRVSIESDRVVITV